MGLVKSRRIGNGRRRRRRVGIAGLIALSLGGCAPSPAPAETIASAPPVRCVTPGDRLEPDSGVLLGVNLDWGSTTVDAFAEQLGRFPAVAVSFAEFPLTDTTTGYLHGAAQQLEGSGGILLLTLEPFGGLQTVTPDAARELAAQLATVNDLGVPVIVRFAHEMNGSWYPWSQQPESYIEAFRTVAEQLHSTAPGSAMMWAPNYGGGYPFAGGRYEGGGSDAPSPLLDTDGDGAMTPLDDPYAPYYPGDDVVDWVGMSLYHWGSTHPWGENEMPEADKFASQLTGEYNGLGGDDSAVPDFYSTYAVERDKPLAIPETAAFFVHGQEGEDELAIKQAWWQQVFSPENAARFPNLHMINWFEWNKEEPEVGTKVDWTLTRTTEIRDSFAADLPDFVLDAEDLPDACRMSSD